MLYVSYRSPEGGIVLNDLSHSHIMMGDGYSVRRRQIGTRQEDEKKTEQFRLAEYDNKKNATKRKRGGLFRFSSILVLCLSTFAVVFLVLNTRDDWKEWSQMQSQLQHLVTVVEEPDDPLAARRFPKFGTREFAKQCSWTTQPTPMEPKCTLLARPRPAEWEGISQWVADDATTFILAKLIGCEFFMDYGPGINIHEVLIPVSTRNPGSTSQPLNWTVPADFECEWKPPEKKCIQRANHEEGPSPVALAMNISLPELPKYRFAYERKERYLNKSDYFELEQVLPGFHVETGMACALSSLFDLSPRASQFEPELFTKIIPAIHDEKTLTVAIYIRTGLTEIDARKEAKGDGGDVYNPVKRYAKPKTVKCALTLEQDFLKQSTDGLTYSRVVWMVVADSQAVKQWITENYSGQEVARLSPKSKAGEEDKSAPLVVKREVLSTRARGVHTRNIRKPSTLDFAEAVIDWFLIGESDVVIANGPSFGATGSLRTARPYYSLQFCTFLPTVH